MAHLRHGLHHASTQHDAGAQQPSSKQKLGTSPVVQWRVLHTPSAGGPGLTPNQGTRSHTPQLKVSHATGKIEDPMCCN